VWGSTARRTLAQATKHPRWNLQPTVRVGCSQVAAKDNTARPLNCLMNADPQVGPWMPRIQQFPKLGTVGVLKPCCTTRSGPTPQSDTSHQRQTCSCLRSPRVASCATPTGSTGHAGASASLKLNNIPPTPLSWDCSLRPGRFQSRTQALQNFSRGNYDGTGRGYWRPNEPRRPYVG